MDTSDGLGSAPSGPSFTTPGPGPVPPPAPLLPVPPPVGPPRRRGPALITAAIIAAVLFVVAVASVLAYRADSRAEEPIVARPRPVAAPVQDDRIAFDGPDGTGQLIMVSREWVRDGTPVPQSGHFLRVEIELVCETGTVDYEPADFQVFDRTGRLFDVSPEGITGDELGVGTLLPGERIRGTLAFDLPRGAATLMMSDRTEQTITALKVPD